MLTFCSEMRDWGVTGFVFLYVDDVLRFCCKLQFTARQGVIDNLVYLLQLEECSLKGTVDYIHSCSKVNKETIHDSYLHHNY